MKSIRVLFVDDDAELRKFIELTFTRSGFQVLCAENGYSALDIWRNNHIDIIVMDIMMPGMDGLETARRIRRLSEIPIIFLTARSLEHDILSGFDLGADDYVVKPFRPKELIARIQAVVKRQVRKNPAYQSRLAYKNLVLDLEARCVKREGKMIEVSPLEFHLLQYLMRYAGTALSKEDLLENVWGYQLSEGDMNFIEAAVRRLRKKLELDPSEPEYIQTVWGVGYRLGDLEGYHASLS